ncbi:MAG TPA: ATP-binding cassette domain-containing protein [Anaerolineae bacterium]|mgnify:CR=1 FL=1|nr:ATP-binding cassette domain-containing protein [Anaerolineae bacterium]HOU24461.1 ATP-binding cassette domain-containing protein [Anaerolineae bacterium]HQJ51308.1 ATP-binding cassette domain-containing protein [Anaerolineae bacterium]
MIEFEHVTYTYPGASGPALSDVTLSIAEGEFVLVAGPSGAGKSTLLRCINGLVPHFSGGVVSGRIRVAGNDPLALGPQSLSRVVGFVFQDPEAQFVLDRVEDEIAFALENAALSPSEMRVRVEEVLNLLDLAPLRNRTLQTLSGGEKQRVAIAAALAFRPRVLVLDEPTSQLDPQSAEDVLNALTRLNVDQGLTVVLAEHRLERVLPHVDRLVYLSREPLRGEGMRVLSGTPREVLRQVDLAPQLVVLGKALGWEPLPLTVKEGRAFANGMASTAPDTSVRPSRSRVPGEALLSIDRLSFAYNGSSALAGVSLTVHKGELVVLMGRNGSGKTTLLKCIVGILRPDRGEVKLAGESLLGKETAEIGQQVGYLPQDPDDLLFADSVNEELGVTLRYHNLLANPPIPPGELLQRLGLSDVATAYPRDLSVGQRQRVGLGAVTVTRPRLLMLDEPTRGLDYSAKQALVRLLREWQAEGVGVLLVTHDVELAAQAADRVVILSQGEIVADDTPEVLTVSPLFAPQVARLFPGRGWLVVEDALRGLGKA